MTRQTLKRSAVLAAAVAGVTVAGLAAAGPFGGGLGSIGQGPFALFHALDLDESQRAAVHRMVEDGRADKEALHDLREASLDTLVAELTAEGPDRAVVHGLVDDGLGQASALLHARVDDLLDIYATFDQDQRAVVLDHIQETRAMHADRVDALHDRIRMHLHGDR